MLIGQAPFHSKVHPRAANAYVIMEKIIHGSIDFEQPEWASVSPAARDCVKGAYIATLTLPKQEKSVFLPVCVVH